MPLLNHRTSNEYVALITQASQIIKDWLDTKKLYQGGSSEQIKNDIQLKVTVEGTDIESILYEMQSTVLPSCVSTAHYSCLAHLHPPSLLVGQLAELFIAATNQSMDSWNQSPIATHMETQLIEWLCQYCALGTDSSGVFTSGGTQSNLMGLLFARNRFYDKKSINIHQEGVCSTLKNEYVTAKIICSDQAHFSVEKNAALLGLGSQNVVKVATDDHGRMKFDDFTEAADKIGHSNIIAVVATAGTTDAGAIDPIIEIANYCQDYQVWLHIDAAWGGALILSQRYRDLISGIQLADSITLDFHKHFFLPISCGAFLLADKGNYDSIRHHSDYLNSEDDERDSIPNLVTHSLQTTRRFDALKLWMALEHLGTKKYAHLIDGCIDVAKQAAKYIVESDEYVLVAPVQLSSVIFYYSPSDSNLTQEQSSQISRKIAQTLLLANIANIATTQFKGQFCLKFTILNASTSVEDVAMILREAAQIGSNFIKSLS